MIGIGARHARRRARTGDPLARSRDAVDKIFVADYAITAQNNFSPIPIAAADAVADAPGVEAVASVRTGEALVYGNALAS